MVGSGVVMGFEFAMDLGCDGRFGLNEIFFLANVLTIFIIEIRLKVT